MGSNNGLPDQRTQTLRLFPDQGILFLGLEAFKYSFKTEKPALDQNS
jgi:hypothetical protein